MKTLFWSGSALLIKGKEYLFEKFRQVPKGKSFRRYFDDARFVREFTPRRLYAWLQAQLQAWRKELGIKRA